MLRFHSEVTTFREAIEWYRDTLDRMEGLSSAAKAELSEVMLKAHRLAEPGALVAEAIALSRLFGEASGAPSWQRVDLLDEEGRCRACLTHDIAYGPNGWKLEIDM